MAGLLDALMGTGLLAQPQPQGLLGAALERNPAHPPEWWNRGVRNVAGGVGSALAEALMFPGKYARGETGYTPGQMASEQPRATNWAADTAFNMAGVPGGRGGMGSGARLPMDEASRMARAKSQGFDPSTTWLHGSASDFNEFRPGAGSSGVYMTTIPDEAARYAEIAGRYKGGGETIYPLNIRGKFATPKDWDAAETAIGGGSYVPSKRVQEELTKRGFTGFRDDDIAIVFDPKNVRSKFAAFDPINKDSANLLGSLAGALGLGSIYDQSR